MGSEEAAGAFTLQIIFSYLIFFMLAFFIFGIQHVQTQDFKNYVDGQLERNGGYTSAAASSITKHSKDNYQGRYKVKSLSGSVKKPYGQTIDYEIIGTIDVVFMDLPNAITSKKGSTISLVR